MTPDVVCVGGLFIDDIVFPDGRTKMGIIGGGSTHAAMGAVVWDERPGVAMVAGKDAPTHAKTFIDRYFETTGLIWLDTPQIRAWQLFEWDGRRTELYRVENISPYLVEPFPSQLPEAYQSVKGLHLLKDGGNEIQQWRELCPNAVICWEPQQHFMVAENAEVFRKTVSIPDIVSPNLLEASCVYGFDEPEKLVDTILADGANIVALRMGEKGSIVADARQRFNIPAVHMDQIVDQTGAGNTYCGAFLVGWLRSNNLRKAGYSGAVAASFCLEEIGVLHWEADKVETRDKRYKALLGRT
ncbi:MAG: PfkB family carbohydrate kinase [Chloroflexota bacterium]